MADVEKFEYDYIAANDMEEVKSELNRMGEEGWQLCSHWLGKHPQHPHKERIFLLERRKPAK